MLNTTKLGGLSLAIAGTALALGTFASRPGDAAMSKDKRRAIVKAVPLLVTLVQKDGKILGIASFGSGTTVTPKGHIFTANHVIEWSHPLPAGISVVPEMYVYVTPENNADPIPICTFNPRHMPHDPVLDIAMVMCEHDLKGNAWPGTVSWPVVPLGDPASMTQGDDLWIFGYPGAGLDPRKKASELFVLPSMNVSEGKFAGVVNERDDDGHHISWVKTDAEISGGNSGGCATDDDGNYLGAPTEVHTDVRDSRNGDGGTLGHVGFIRPTNLFKPYIEMAQKGWVPSDTPADDPEPAAGPGVVVSGSIVSADTGEPASGLLVVVFKQGVTARQIMASSSPAELMLTRGESDEKGQFTLETKVPKGSYTVAVIGQGYKPLIDDDALVIDDKTPPKYRAWNKIAVRRCAPNSDCLR